MRPFLIGEANPYSSDPDDALYPFPEEATGGRLARILGMSNRDYLRAFERRNLCARRWSVREAKASVVRIIGELRGAPLVLLGARVARAWGWPFEPFTVRKYGSGSRVLILPHPSGRCRIWNEPGARERASRMVLAELCDYCGGPGYYFIDGKRQKCICSEPQA